MSTDSLIFITLSRGPETGTMGTFSPLIAMLILTREIVCTLSAALPVISNMWEKRGIQFVSASTSTDTSHTKETLTYLWLRILLNTDGRPFPRLCSKQTLFGPPPNGAGLKGYGLSGWGHGNPLA